MSPVEKANIFQAAASLTQAFCNAIGQGQAGQALKAQVDPNFADPGETQVAIWVWEAFKIFNMGLQKALWDRTFEATGGGEPKAPKPTAPTTPAPTGGVPTSTMIPGAPPVVSAALANLAEHLGI